MILRGEISLIRALTDHAVWQGDLALRGAWVDLLLRANTEDAILVQRGETVNIKRGQLAWSLGGLAKVWGVCEEKAGKILSFLQQMGCIRVERTRRRTVITICNYEIYQAPRLESVTDSDTGAVAGSVTDSDTGAVAGSVTESVTGSVTESVQSRELGDRRHTPRARGAVPEWAEVEAFAVDSKVNAGFARDWFERKANSLTHGFETVRDWRFDLLLFWRRSGVSAGENGAAVEGGGGGGRPENPVARRIRLERRLKALGEEMEGHIINCSAPPYHELELKEYENLRAERRKVKEELDAI